MQYTLRQTTPADYPATEALTRDAFWDQFQPGCTEHLMVRQIRASDDYVPALDYMAVLADGTIVGHILYSRSYVVEADGTQHPLLTFGPLSVRPDMQGRGIGGALIGRTKAEAAALDWAGIAIYGHPGYYPRFGFRDAQVWGITTPEGENFPALMALELTLGGLEHYVGGLYTSPAFETTPEAVAAFDAQFPPRTKRYGSKPE